MAAKSKAWATRRPSDARFVGVGIYQRISVKCRSVTIMSILSALRAKTNVPLKPRSRRLGWMGWCGILLLILFQMSCDRDSYLKFAGYNRASLMKKNTPQDDEALAMGSIELLRQKQFEQVEERLDPSIKNADLRSRLVAMAEMFPAREPSSIKTVDASHSKGSSTTSITLEYEFSPGVTTVDGKAELSPGSWFLAQAFIQKKGDVKTVAGLLVRPISESVEVYNEFTLLDKGVSQYAGLLLAILVSVFGLYVFVLCARTKMGKKKWIWLMLMVPGVCRLTVNWTTGQWSFTPLSVQVKLLPLIANLTCTAYGPWMLQITAPLGAIAFLIWRNAHLTSGTLIASQNEERVPSLL